MVEFIEVFKLKEYDRISIRVLPSGMYVDAFKFQEFHVRLFPQNIIMLDLYNFLRFIYVQLSPQLTAKRRGVNIAEKL